MIKFATPLMALLLLAGAAPARDVAASDSLRKTLLDALRPDVERDLGQKVKFVVRLLRVQDSWAFATLVPRTPVGAPIDFGRTRHAERQREGMLDGDTLYALLQQGPGGWRVRTFVIGPTDVTWAGWPEEYGAPKTLFGLEPGE